MLGSTLYEQVSTLKNQYAGENKNTENNKEEEKKEEDGAIVKEEKEGDLNVKPEGEVKDGNTLN